MAEILVLGAGIVGVCSALALQARGHAVRLVDRRGPGEETSYGNSGVIQAEARAPVPMPRDLVTLWRVATGQTNMVRYKLSDLSGQIRTLAAYFRASGPTRYAKISQSYAPLIARAIADHAALIGPAGANAIVRTTGLGEIYDTEGALQDAIRDAEAFAEIHGLKVRCVDGTELRREDPGIVATVPGAVIWEDPWNVSDPGGLVRAYSDLFVARGGDIERADIADLFETGAGWEIASADGAFKAEHLVLALGPWTPGLLASLGYRIPMVLKRGYHGHFEMEASLSRPYHFARHSVVATTMSKGLRITTGAHMAPLGAAEDWRQLEAGKAAFDPLLDIGAEVPDGRWHGTRPCLPGMLPCVGALPRHKNLWVNFGHGHQGLTLGPTTGALLAELVAGEVPALAEPLRPGLLV
ncbi:MAG: FAD-dependent oxidoreductase [Pseudomonadota bacterium]